MSSDNRPELKQQIFLASLELGLFLPGRESNGAPGCFYFAFLVSDLGVKCEVWECSRRTGAGRHWNMPNCEPVVTLRSPCERDVCGRWPSKRLTDNIVQICRLLFPVCICASAFPSALIFKVTS